MYSIIKMPKNYIKIPSGRKKKEIKKRIFNSASKNREGIFRNHRPSVSIPCNNQED
jgi:hypothetical protein